MHAPLTIPLDAGFTVQQSADRNADRFTVGILIVAACVAALTFRDYGLGWDDYTHAEYGGLLLKLYASGFTDQRALSFVNLYAYGGGFDMLAGIVAKILPFELFETRRLVGAAVGLGGIVIAWRIARRLGGPIAGLIAVALLITCPLYYGHIFMNAKDAPFAVAMAFLTLAFVRAFEEYPRPNVVTRMMIGIGIGLALGTRIMAGLAAFYVAAALITVVAIDARRLDLREALSRAGSFVVCLLPSLLLAYAVMALVWPWSVVDPLNPIYAVQYFSHFFEKPWKEMFAGSLVSVPDMPRRYLPTLLLLKEPEIFITLTFGGCLAAVVAAIRGRETPNRRAVLVLLVMAGLFPVAYTVLMKPAMYNGTRHFVFIVPPLAILGGLGGAWLLDRLRQRSNLSAALAAGVIGIGLMSPVIEMIRLHPYQYTHFNRIAGGIRANEASYMLDYWGLAFKQAAKELRAKLAEDGDMAIPARRWKIAVCGPQRTAQVELGPSFVAQRETLGADFALTLNEFYCADFIKAPVLVEIEREGVVYARVYDIRGQGVTNLDAKPAP